MLQRKRQNDLVLIRVLSMLMIVLCHITGYYTFIPGSNILPNIFNVGVYIFLILSGYLYGAKESVTFSDFIKKRFRRVFVPALVVVFINIACLYILFSETYTIMTYITYLLNLQGLLFVNWKFFGAFISEIPNLGPFWFITIIMLCYCLIPLLFWLRKKLSIKAQILMCILGLCTCAILEYALGFNVYYFFTFYLGFLLPSIYDKEKKLSIKKIIFFTITMLILQILRVYMQQHIDGSVFYVIFTSYSHIALALTFFGAVVEFNKRFSRLVDRIANSLVIKIADKHSFNVYLVHGIFCMGSTNLYVAIPNIWLATIAFIFAVLTASMILHLIDQFITKFCEKFFNVKL